MKEKRKNCELQIETLVEYWRFSGNRKNAAHNYFKIDNSLFTCTRKHPQFPVLYFCKGSIVRKLFHEYQEMYRNYNLKSNNLHNMVNFLFRKMKYKELENGKRFLERLSILSNN